MTCIASESHYRITRKRKDKTIGTMYYFRIVHNIAVGPKIKLRKADMAQTSRRDRVMLL